MRCTSIHHQGWRFRPTTKKQRTWQTHFSVDRFSVHCLGHSPFECERACERSYELRNWFLRRCCRVTNASETQALHGNRFFRILLILLCIPHCTFYCWNYKRTPEIRLQSCINFFTIYLRLRPALPKQQFQRISPFFCLE